MEILHSLFKISPEAALFLSLEIGYAVGKIQLERFQAVGKKLSAPAGDRRTRLK
jgi:hypothetical protein